MYVKLKYQLNIEKNQYTWGEYNRGAWTVCRFKGRLAKKSGVIFLREGEGGGGGVYTPIYTMEPNK